MISDQPTYLHTHVQYNEANTQATTVSLVLGLADPSVAHLLVGGNVSTIQ